MFNEKLFRSKLVLHGITIAELAKEVGIHETSMYSKIKREGAFLRDEIQKIRLILDLTDEEVIDIFFAEKLN